MYNVSCRRDMAETLLKAAQNTIQAFNAICVTIPERHGNASCRRDVTEILLKAA